SWTICNQTGCQLVCTDFNILRSGYYNHSIGDHHRISTRPATPRTINGMAITSSYNDPVLVPGIGVSRYIGLHTQGQGRGFPIADGAPTHHFQNNFLIGNLNLVGFGLTSQASYGLAHNPVNRIDFRLVGGTKIPGVGSCKWSAGSTYGI